MKEKSSSSTSASPPKKRSSHIKAVASFGPRIKQEKTIPMRMPVELVSRTSNLSEGIVINVLRELFWAINHHLKNGQAIYLDSLGTFTPKISLDGSFNISYLASKRLKAEMKVPGWFQGDIYNRDMIGKSVDELITRWNDEHPDDPII